MLISEIHCTGKSYVNIPYYNVYHTNHPDGCAHDGSAILIRNKIKHSHITPYCEDYIQATSMVVDEWAGPLTIAAICPPKHRLKEIHFTDFNAKHTHWRSRITLPRGRELLKIIEKMGLNAVSSGHPTY